MYIFSFQKKVETNLYHLLYRLLYHLFYHLYPLLYHLLYHLYHHEQVSFCYLYSQSLE